jgi:[ribosomal protein S5]-alanine N-acetyltransferase
MRIETERLVIRSLADEDLPEIHRILDEAFGEGGLATDPAALAERRSWLAWTQLSEAWLGKLYQPPYGERAVTLKASGALIGAVGYVPCLMPFAQIPELRGAGPAHSLATPEVGLFWAIDRQQRRQRYATEAARAFIAHAFETLNLMRIVATTEYDNTESQGVMHKLGMQVLRNPQPDPPWMQVVGVLNNPRLKESHMETENRNASEAHGCVVCGRVYNMLVVYSPSGEMIDCTVMSMGAHRVYDPKRPLVACDRHTQAEVQAAQARKAARDREEAEREARGD